MFSCKNQTFTQNNITATGPELTIFHFREKWVSFGVTETIVGSLLCCGVGIVRCLFKVIS